MGTRDWTVWTQGEDGKIKRRNKEKDGELKFMFVFKE